MLLCLRALYESTTDGKTFVDCFKDQNIMPGIKVDKDPTMNLSAKVWMDWLQDVPSTTNRGHVLQSDEHHNTSNT